MKNTYKNPKPCNTKLSTKTREYEIDGKIFVVKPVYKETATESATSILIKLMKSES